MALVGPLIAMVMIAVMAVLLHRSLRASEPEPEPAPAATEPVEPRARDLTDTGSMPDDYGLLAPAAVTRTRADALLVKEQLRGAGIRSTLANTADGQVQVLVFGDQVVRARRLVGWSGQKP
ncbi:MAG TPA: hypothetical protein VF062_16005 [Candidatus Limnocylindrales bacterium]